MAADSEFCALVQCALDLTKLTDGRFDPTIGVLRRAWDFRLGRVPSAGELEGLLSLVDATKVEVGGGMVFLKNPGMELDLGGVGKEYAVDCVADLLLAEGGAN